VVYRRHTNFSQESIEQTFAGAADVTSTSGSRKVTCTISRNGDLIHKMYLRTELPAITGIPNGKSFAWVSEVGHALIKSVELEIGGQHTPPGRSEGVNALASGVYTLRHCLMREIPHPFSNVRPLPPGRREAMFRGTVPMPLPTGNNAVFGRWDNPQASALVAPRRRRPSRARHKAPFQRLNGSGRMLQLLRCHSYSARIRL
jgi:hypothetical protein